MAAVHTYRRVPKVYACTALLITNTVAVIAQAKPILT